MRWVAMSVAASTITTSALGQCPGGWDWAQGWAGVDGEVRATAWWDRDGNGPQPPVLVVAGSFSTAGTAAASNIAVWDGATWSGLGPRLDGAVNALLPLPDGRLAVGGAFTHVGAVVVAGVAVIDGATGAWSALGGGFGGGSNPVIALVRQPNGRIAAATPTSVGTFTPTSGQWSSSGAFAADGAFPASIKCLAVTPEGDLLIGGRFASGGRRGLERWPLQPGGPTSVGPGFDGEVSCLSVAPDGAIYAGVNSAPGGIENEASVQRWNGTAWSRVDVPLTYSWNGVRSLRAEAGGAVYALGDFWYANGRPVGGLVKYDGSGWQPVGGGFSGHGVTVSRSPSGELVIGGGPYCSSGNRYFAGIARLTSQGDWRTYGPGFTVDAQGGLAILASGDIVVGAQYADTDGRVMGAPVAWNGTAWCSLANGDGIDGWSYKLVRLSRDRLLALGFLFNVDGHPVTGLAYWDGVVWGDLGGTFNADVLCAAEGPSGDIVVGGWFTAAGGVEAHGIARWDGAQWHALGTGVTDGHVDSVVFIPNGDVVAGGAFTMIGGCAANGVAAWNGTEWRALGYGFVHSEPFAQEVSVDALFVQTDGSLLAGGTFKSADGQRACDLMRWDGERWLPFGNTTHGDFWGWEAVRGICQHPEGLVFGGPFGTLYTDQAVSIWDGQAWQSLGLYGGANQVAVTADGAVVVAGQTWFWNDPTAARLRRWRSGGRPVVTVQPQDASVCGHASVSFSVSAHGEPGEALTYQWLKDGEVIDRYWLPSSLTSTLVIPDSTFQSGLYSCRVTGACGQINTVAARLTSFTADVSGPPPYHDRDGVLDNNDLIRFIDDFFGWFWTADVGSGGGTLGSDGQLDNNDFIVFIDLFFTGC